MLYYTQSRSNERIVQALQKEFSGLKNKFIRPVPLNEAIVLLSGISPKERAVLIWGSSWEHGFSFYFEIKKGYGLKIGIDSRANMRADDNVNFQSHFFHSSKGNHDVVLHMPTKYGFELGDSTKNGDTYDHKHISIDLDFIDGFPIESCFSTGEGSISALMNLMRMSVAHSVMRLDLGGMKSKPTNEEFDRGIEAYIRIFRFLENEDFFDNRFELPLRTAWYYQWFDWAKKQITASA